MPLNWVDRQDGVDDILAEDINKIAHSVVDLEKNSVKYANAIKAVASGTAIRLQDVSPIEHELKVRVESENLASDIAVGGNTTFENGVATQITADTYAIIYTKAQVYKGSTFILGADVLTLTSTGRYSMRFTKPAEGDTLVFGINGQTLDTAVKIDIADLPEGVYTVSADFTNITQGSISWRDIMLNKGATAKPYTPPVSDLSAVKLLVQGQSGTVIECPVKADGTVDGVKSDAPSITLMTDTEGVLIECEYNRDANAFINNLAERIIALEDAILNS
jgi:hypothetical protein